MGFKLKKELCGSSLYGYCLRVELYYDDNYVDSCYIKLRWDGTQVGIAESFDMFVGKIFGFDVTELSEVEGFMFDIESSTCISEGLIPVSSEKEIFLKVEELRDWVRKRLYSIDANLIQDSLFGFEDGYVGRYNRAYALGQKETYERFIDYLENDAANVLLEDFYANLEGCFSNECDDFKNGVGAAWDGIDDRVGYILEVAK